MKILLALLLLGALISLFTGLYFMIKDPGESRRTARALTARVVFCIAIVLTLVLLLATGELQLNQSPI